jgi:hypothetical protein
LALTIVALGFSNILISRRLRKIEGRGQREGQEQSPRGQGRRSFSGIVMGGMALVSLVFVGIIVAVGIAAGDNQTIALPLLLITGVVIYLGALAALVVVFRRQGLANRNYALGLPDGSIRAIIALSLILLFAILAIFLYIGQGGFGTTTLPTLAQTDIAKQLVTTLSTLVVAIASFYFGSTTVREAKKPPDEEPAHPGPTDGIPPESSTSEVDGSGGPASVISDEDSMGSVITEEDSSTEEDS